MKYFVLFLMLITSNIVLAQGKKPHKILYDEMYYNAFNELIDKKDSLSSGIWKNLYFDALGILYSYIGEYDKAKEVFIKLNKDKGFIPDSLTEVDLSNCGITQIDLNNLYERYNVVMFNESHHFSKHRAFLYSQLEILKDLGFNQIALETLNLEDSDIHKRGYPIKKTGYYTNDPVFGNLIRKALSLGYTLIPYESKTRNPLFREKAQAKNLFKKYKPSVGKLVVLAGYGHIAETGKFKMMAQHFKKKTKEDILSIAQFTHYHIQPVFPSDNNNDFFLQKDTTNYYDYFFFAKPNPSNNNIPYWYNWMNFKTKPLKEIYNKPINYPTLVQLHNINENGAVPVYQYMIEKEGDVFIAYPKEGKYILKIIDKSGESEYIVKL